MTEQKRPLLITTGEPAGIGMDVVLNLAAEGKLQDFVHAVQVDHRSATVALHVCVIIPPSLPARSACSAGLD